MQKMFSSQRAGLRPYFSSGTSWWVMTSLTPGSFSASEVSMERIRAWAWGLALVLLAACGGDSGASSKSAWTKQHGPALDALETELDAARATLSSLQRPNILGSCTALRDSLEEVRKGLPVPDQKSNTALRNGFTQAAAKFKLHFAPFALCTDNAVMIAVAGYYKYMRSSPKKFVAKPMEVDSTLALRNW